MLGELGAEKSIDTRTMSGLPRPLFLAYHFPPIGGAGGQRPAKLVRYLRELGFFPAVVTGPGRADGRWTPLDETLGRDTLRDLEIHRVTGEPSSPSDWQDRTERWLWIRSNWSRWWVEECVAQGEKVDGVDVVYALMRPTPLPRPPQSWRPVSESRGSPISGIPGRSTR